MATQIGTAFFDVTFNTTAARRELTALVSTANRQFGLIGGVGLVGATIAVGALVSITTQVGAAALSAANDYEVAFARVRKTLDDGSLSAEQTAVAFGRLNDELRQIALEVPLDLSDEIANIAALGGQMGIERTEIAEFTRVIGELGVTTTLSVDDAATAFARLSNILGVPQEQFREMGDTLVNLGNNLPATEDEIIRFSLRIAAAGEIVGFTEDQVLALAGAMTAVGVPAERGGTAIQTALIRIQQAVADGGDQLEILGDVAGVTAEEFANAWRTDPANAFRIFVEGLGQLGDDAFFVLRELQLANQRTIQALLSIANAGPLLGDALNLAADSAGSLARESDIFFNTTASNLQLLGNAVENAGIQVGDKLQGPFNDIINTVRTWIQENPELIDQLGTDLATALEDIGSIIDENIDSLNNIVTIIGAVAREAASTVKPLADMAAGLLEVAGTFAEGRSFFQEEAEQGGVGGFFAQIADFATSNLPQLFGKAIDNITGPLDRAAATASEFDVEKTEGFERFLAITPPFSGILVGLQAVAGLGAEQMGVLAQATDDLVAQMERGRDPVQAVVDAIVVMDARLRTMGGSLSEFGFTTLTEEAKLTEDQINRVIDALRRAGVAIPTAITLGPGLPPELLGPGGSGFGPGIPPPLSPGRMRELQSLLEEEALAEAEELADNFSDALADIADRAADTGVPLSVLLDNLEQLAPDLVGVVEQFGAGVIESELFAQSLQNLNNSINFDTLTNEFDLLLTVTNKAGDEVPATVGQMIEDLRQQAEDLARLEAATTILDVLGFNDLANELREKGPDAANAAEEFVDHIERAAEAESLLDNGTFMGENLLGALQDALANGDVSKELLDLAAQFNSAQVKDMILNAGTELGGLFGQALLDAIDIRTNIRIPVELIPEIQGSSGGIDPTGDVDLTGSRRRPSGNTRVPDAVIMNFNAHQIPTTDTARAAQLARSIVGG